MLTLLDTTLRDGSYVVDFQFTARDTALIAGALDACGVPLIEVGHGVGLRGGLLKNMRSASTDAEYCSAAGSAVRRGKWGMFCIPGISQLDDLNMLADHGAGFVRIGTNVTEVALAAPFIARARALGLWVSANFMKTYALPPNEVGVEALRAFEQGAELVCVVDSAGGMLPEDVDAYFTGIRGSTNAPIGFHAHDNLGLAIANTLRAVELGAAVVDTSLRGMGRSAGNACTEILVLALKRRGIDLGLDPLQLLSIAEQRIDPMLRQQQPRESIGIVSGYAQFHSSFLSTVFAAASRHKVDARALIIAVTQEDKINAAPELVERQAIALAGMPVAPVAQPAVLPERRAAATTQTTVAVAGEAAREAHIIARRLGKSAVFNVVQAWRKPGSTSAFRTVHEGPQFVIASAEAGDAGAAAEITKSVAAEVDWILLDIDLKSKESVSLIEAVRQSAGNTPVLSYSDLESWARAVALTVAATTGPGDNVHMQPDRSEGAPLATRCSAIMRAYGVRVDDASPATLMVAFAPLDAAHALATTRGIFRVVDAWIGAIPAAVLPKLHERNVIIERPDMRAVIHAEVAVAIGVRELVGSARGLGSIEGVPVAAGGVVPSKGTVIVDSLRAPKQVFGIADGLGLLIPEVDLTDTDEEMLVAVERRVALIGQ